MRAKRAMGAWAAHGNDGAAVGTDCWVWSIRRAAAGAAEPIGATTLVRELGGGRDSWVVVSSGYHRYSPEDGRSRGTSTRLEKPGETMMGTMLTGIWMVLMMALPQATKDEAVKLASEALAHDLGLSIDSVEVRRASPVDWSDASLGCPKEGELYAQVIVPGYRVSLQADGQLYSVHVGGGSAVVCESPMRPVEGATAQDTFEAESETPIDLPESPRLRELVAEARQDLAKRLDVEAGTIDLLEASEVVWRDASLGCPEPGKMYAQSTREGYLVRLRSGKRVYRYHSGLGGAPFLCERPAR